MRKVSCHVITYNHVNFIKDCLDSILMQKTNFDFEIIVGDDLSTDGTREILMKYANLYPNLFKLNLRHKRGIGVPGKENFVSTLKMCKGEYISLCDGDDYWTDPYKLQKQVDFLEGNPEYALCFHPVKILEETGKIVNDYLTSIPINFESIAKLAEYGNYIHTPTVLFRNVLQKIPSEFEYSPVGDYFLYLLISEYGKIGQLTEKMAIYRHNSGLWSKQTNVKRNFQFCLTLSLLSNYFSEKNPNIALILEKRAYLIFNNIAVYLSAEDLKSFRVNNEINAFIDKMIINTIQEYDSDRIIKSKWQKLIKILFQRVIKKITKKIPN